MDTSTEGSIQIEGLLKVFGEKPEHAVALVKQGLSRSVIKKRTGSVVALRSVSFRVRKGETFVVMGLSGSGKSTLLRCVNRLVEPTAGAVLVDGQDVNSFSKEELMRFRRRKVGMVFQHFALLPHRTVLENVVFGLELAGVAKQERNQKGKEVLEQVDLQGWEAGMIDQLSGGMRQRVGLARALAINPEILLMDEPFSALDPLIRARMQDELLQLQQKLKKTILFITHDLNEAIKIGDRIGVLNQEGEMVQVGTPREIFRSPATEFVKRFVENIDEQAKRVALLGS